MAHQTIYKNVGLANETSYGASIAPTASRIRVTSVGLNLNPNKEVVEDTVTSVKGRDRIVNLRNSIEGSIEGFGTPRNLHHMFELVNGQVGSSVALLGGTNVGIVMTYNQNTSGSMLTKSLVLDRNNSQELFNGVAGRKLTLSFSDGLLEYSLDATAKTRASGPAVTDNVAGETIKPFNFADFTVYIQAGSTFVTAEALTLKVSECEITYDNDHEVSFLSGNANADRIDPKIPTLEGKLKIFHEGSSWTAATFGASEFWMRLEGVLPTGSGQINVGNTPYLLRIDMPRTQLMTNERNYEQNELSIEEIAFNGLLNLGASYLWQPSITGDINFIA